MKRIKKTLAFLVAAVMIAVGFAPATLSQAASKPQFTVKTSNANLKPGEVFTAELWLEPNAGVTSIATIYTFDVNAFELVEHKEGEALKAMDMGMLLYDASTPGEIGVIADWDKEANVAGGQMCVLKLKVKDNASASGKIAVEGSTGTVPGAEGGEDATISMEDIVVRIEDAKGNEIKDGNLSIDVPLNSIAFKNKVETLQVGQTAQLEIVYSPDNTTADRTVTWSSSDKSVAEVNNGLVKACKEGKTTITAKVGDKEISFELKVTKKATSTQQKPSQQKPSQQKPSSQNKPAANTGDTMNVLAVMMLVVVSASVVGFGIWKKEMQ